MVLAGVPAIDRSGFEWMTSQSTPANGAEMTPSADETAHVTASRSAVVHVSPGEARVTLDRCALEPRPCMECGQLGSIPAGPVGASHLCPGCLIFCSFSRGPHARPAQLRRVRLPVALPPSDPS